MHFTNKSKERRYCKGVKVLAALLSVMLVVSMLAVGNITVLNAKAEHSGDGDTGNSEAQNDYIYPGKTFYIDISQVSSWWLSDNAVIKLLCWNDGVDGAFSTVIPMDDAHKVQDNIYYFIFQDDWCAKNFRIERYASDGTTLWNQTDRCENQTVDRNCIQILKTESNGKKQIHWSYFDDSAFFKGTTTSTAANRKLEAKQGFGETEDGVNLFPVSTAFYDYYTDYEIEYGWRSMKAKNAYRAVSRSYMNSFPFNHLNKYISGKANSASGWQYPLYFGNFFTYTGYYYSTDKQSPRFNNTDPDRNTSAVWRFNQSSPLRKFSSQANNSMFLQNNGETAVKYNDGVHNSFVGLVNSTLTSDNITMGTGEVAVPYFSDSLVNDGYATKVTTKFPMRVTEETTSDTGAKYKKYSFNSYGGRDNVYFSGYGTSDFKLNYSTNKKTYDALAGFGGTNGVGFFPFDNENGNATDNAYDFGFGARWDIPFNLTSDGKITGSNESIKFTFSGDDDVWVFVDGQLALDLGGDHQWARGEIDFANKTSTITTGVYIPNGDYGNPINYNKIQTTNLSYNNGVAQLNQGVFADSEFYSKPHTLTVFYMERGMSESNLSMEFTMSPLENELTVDKTVNYNSVNSQLREKTKEYAANDTFEYTVKVNDSTSWTNTYAGSTAGARPVYKLDDSTTANTLPTTGKVTGIKDGHKFTFNKQLDDAANASQVDIKESAGSSNNYTYSAHMSVVDISNNNHTDTDTDTDEVNFGFHTASTQTNAVTKFDVHNVNTVKTADLTVSKTYAGTGNFDFEVKVKLPGATETITMNDGTNDYFTVAAGGSTTIEDIPVGSQVTVTEKTTGYNVSYVIGTGSSQDGSTATVTNLTADTTVAFTNTDMSYSGSYSPEIKKYINGSVPGSANANKFNFTLTQWDDPATSGAGAVVNGTVLTAANTGADGSTVAFDPLTFTEPNTYWYKITETANSDYTLDDTNPYSNTYYLKCVVTHGAGSELSVDHQYYKSNGTTPVADNAVIFNNKPVVRNGYLRILKTSNPYDPGANYSGTEFRIYKVSGENAEPESGNSGTTLTITDGSYTNETTSINYGAVDTGAIEVGWYKVVETKAPSGYELSTEPEWVQVTADNTEQHPATVTFVNIKSTTLPETGGIGVVLFITIGVVLIGAAILLLKPKKEAKK